MEYTLRKKLRQLWSGIGKVCLPVLAIPLILGCLYIGCEPNDCRILPGVQVDGIDLSGMSLQDARKLLDDSSEAILERTILTAELPKEIIRLSPADTKVKLQTWKAALAAYSAGRFGNQNHIIGLQPYLKLDEAYIRTVLADYAARHDTALIPWSHAVMGTMPNLETDAQTAPKVQTLTVTMGVPTAKLDQEDALQQILAVYGSAFSAAEAGNYRVENHFQVDILEEPETPDLQTIYDSLYIAPVNDALDMESYEVIPGAYGYHFDLVAAEKQIREADWGETLSIPMEFLEPEIFGEEVYFRDVLGYCETKHTQDENRNNNLRRACESMNGLVLQPGDIFSYNDTLGPRTKENGYLRAGAYSGWELVQSYGGGICQGSSTIYGAALLADLEIVIRKNHGYAVSYVPYGLDATVNWGGPDFQFKNNTHFPIKIAAEVSDGLVKVTILGTEERDYYVEMESEYTIGSSVISAQSYKCKYDRETKELISREKEARSNYMR